MPHVLKIQLSRITCLSVYQFLALVLALIVFNTLTITGLMSTLIFIEAAVHVPREAGHADIF